MADPFDQKKDRTIGLKVENWKREAFKEAARRERSTPSAILREKIDETLDGYDVEKLLEARSYEASDQSELEAN